MAVAWQNGPVDYLSNIKAYFETELIGQQCWFTENLECFQYANGVDILATDDIHDFMDWEMQKHLPCTSELSMANTQFFTTRL